MTDQYPLKSTKTIPKPVTYKDGANIDIASGTIGVNPSPDFTGEVSAGKYNLQAGTGLTFDGIKYASNISLGDGLANGILLETTLNSIQDLGGVNFLTSPDNKYVYFPNTHHLGQTETTPPYSMSDLSSATLLGSSHNIAMSPDGDKIYGWDANYTGSIIAEYSVSAGSVINTYQQSFAIENLGIDTTGTILIMADGTGTIIYSLNLSSGITASKTLSSQIKHGFISSFVTTSNGNIYTLSNSGSEIYVISLDTLAITGTISVPDIGRPYGNSIQGAQGGYVAISPDENTMWCLQENGTLLQVDLATNLVTGSIGVSSGGYSIGLLPTTGTLYTIFTSYDINIYQTDPYTLKVITVSPRAPESQNSIVVLNNGGVFGFS